MVEHMYNEEKNIESIQVTETRVINAIMNEYTINAVIIAADTQD